jgi:GT2 family glycosyltransferase
MTDEFLKSISEVNYGAIEVIVVDNGSLKQPVKPLIKKYPEVKFIVNADNLGFAGGNNIGIRQAKGDYILLLNNDTEVEPGFIEPLLSCFQENDRVGMVSPKIIYHGTDSIQFVGSGRISPYTGRSFRAHFKEKDSQEFSFRKPTEMLHGAALMVKREVIDKIGLLPEVYFLYYEEVDWCRQAKNAGFELWVVADSIVYHKESMSIGKNSPFKTYYMTRGRLIYMRRNLKGIQFLSSLLFYILLTVPKNIFVYLLQKDFKNLGAFVKGIKWNFSNKISVY